MIEMEQGIEMESRRLLPESWRWVQLGEICDFNPRRPLLSRAPNSPTTFVPMSAVEEAGRGISCPECRPFSEVRSGYTYFSEGDVLFAKITPCMQNGKHTIAQDLIDSIGFGSTEFHVIRPKAEVTSSWIHWFILQPQILWRAEAYFTGSVGQQRVPQSYLEALEIPLPPLTEQYRITEILTKQIAVVEQARAATELQIEAARELPAACLRSVFDSLEAQQWPRKRIRDFTDTCSGATPRRGYSKYYNGTILWVKTGELRDSIIFDTEEHISEIALHEVSLKLLPTNTLLVAMYGQGQTRGRTGLLSRPATTNQACFAILPRPEEFDPLYLQCWFRYSYSRLRHETEGRGGNQPNLNGDFLRNQQVPLPSIAEQHRIAEKLTEKIAAVKQLCKTLEEQFAAINVLPSALLRRAFSGAL